MTIPIYIGFDEKEKEAAHVLIHSIVSRTRMDLKFHLLIKNQIKEYTRPRADNESTDFSLTRFMVPYLNKYHGPAIFMDCDMLCRCDISEILSEFNDQGNKAIYVCKHEYTPKSDVKFLGQQQTKYERKNWSSFIVFNTGLCTALTPEYVNTAGGLDLHRFKWLDDSEIGNLPLTWNWLVDEYEHKEEAKMIHFTLGGPWFEEYKECDYANEWFAEFERWKDA